MNTEPFKLPIKHFKLVFYYTAVMQFSIFSENSLTVVYYAGTLNFIKRILIIFSIRPALKKSYIFSKKKNFSNFQETKLSYILEKTLTSLELEAYSEPWYVQN